MIESNPLGYETFIAWANNRQRRAFAGAHADIFRNFEHLQEEYRRKREEGADDLEDTAYKAGLQAGKIQAYMSNALDQMKEAHQETIREDQDQEFHNIQELLNNPNLENVHEALDRLGSLYIKLSN